VKGEIVSFIQLVQSRRYLLFTVGRHLLFIVERHPLTSVSANKSEPVMGASCTLESRFVRDAASHVVVLFSFVGKVDVLHCFGHGMARPCREEWHARRRVLGGFELFSALYISQSY
jgi:hypothetical protein